MISPIKYFSLVINSTLSLYDENPLKLNGLDWQNENCVNGSVLGGSK
jgi:hypothetical protein